MQLSFKTEELCADLWCAAEDVNSGEVALVFFAEHRFRHAQKRHERMANIHIMFELVVLIP